MLRLSNSSYRSLTVLLVLLSFACSFLAGPALTPSAQAQSQAASQSAVPALKGYINDFAEVLDAETRGRLETIVGNFREQAGVEFAVVTVKTTGGEDIFDYSLKVAREWGINERARGKKSALLLLVSADDRKSFMQMSKTFAGSLPDGLIGEMNNRLRVRLDAGNFNEGLMTAVQTIVATVSIKRGLTVDGVDAKYAYGVAPPAGERAESTAKAGPATSATSATTATAKEPTAEKSEESAATSTHTESKSQPSETKSETAAAISEASAPESTASAPKSAASETKSAKAEPGSEATAAAPESRAASSKDEAAPAKSEEATPVKSKAAPAKSEGAVAATEAPAASTERSATDARKETAGPEKSAAAAAEKRPANTVRRRAGARSAEGNGNDSEKTELSNALALAPAERIEKLRAFVEAHPRSSLRTRASELIVSARAALGDEKLKAGDAPGGTEQFRLAISESPANMSAQLFAEVISQIPFNLFVRGQRAASIQAARLLEEKVNDDPKRLLAVADFYLSVEDAEDAARVSGAAVKLAPEMPEAHEALGASRRIALKPDEAAAEYARALELNPKATGARRSLADLRRATGKADEALALYREQLKTDASDRQARAGVVLSLLDLGQKSEAETELAAALKDDPKNLALLAGAAYWYAAHGEGARGLQLARQALELEPRYTWAHIALSRSLVQLNRPLDAERSLRFAQQYGRFPTLNYELASTLAAAGLYDEAAEELGRSFALKEGEIETQLAGHNPAHAADFITLLAPERRASIFQPVAADSEANARMLRGLLALSSLLDQQSEGGAVRESEALTTAARDFTAGDDTMRAYRQLYAAARLLRRGVALPLVLELTEAATGGIQAALTAPTATIAVQADELRAIRTQAIAQGGTPSVREAPRNVLSSIMRGRLEDIAGWALFNQDKVADAIVRLRRAAGVLPANTPAAQTALWHLGTALATSGNQAEALNYYFKSYNSGAPDPSRRAIIEALYRKVNGSLDGLDAKIGPAPSANP